MRSSVEFLINKINDSDIIVLGCSGGPDSMCLLDILLKNFSNKQIIIAHVNHNIRKESVNEASFVKQYCQSKEITFESITLPNDKKYNESELRKMRYSFFENIIKKYHAKFLLTAHHGDDLIETILMRITRGSTLKGYTGINLINYKDNYQILRPLLFVTKEEILKYNQDNNIEYVIDNSNQSENYTRNRYRKYMLPFLKKEEPNINLKYLKFSEELFEYYEYVNNIVVEELNKNYQNQKYDLKNYYDLDKLIKRKVIEKILDYNYPKDLDLINKKHVNAILNLIGSKSNGIVNLPNNKIIEKSYNNLIIKEKLEKQETNYEFILNNELEISGRIIKIVNESNDTSNYCIRLLSSEIMLPLHVRSRKLGDKMKVKNLNGSKKIKDILIDEKISLDKRDEIIIVTDDNNNILWIPGVKKSEFDKEISENYDIIIKYIPKVYN